MIHKNLVSNGPYRTCITCGQSWDVTIQQEPPVCSPSSPHEQAQDMRNQLKRSREPISISRHNAERIEQVLSTLCEGMVTVHDMSLAEQQLTRLRELLK